LINEIFLSNLIRGNKISIGCHLTQLGDIKEYYIPRSFQRCITVKDDFLKEIAFIDCYAFSGISKQELSNMLTSKRDIQINTIEDLVRKEKGKIYVVLLNEKNSAEEYKKLCEIYPTYTIHWLKRLNNKFLWQKSQGGLSNLRPFLDKSNIEEFSPKTIGEIREKFVIIAAEPGMGKTTVLTHLALNEKLANNHLWLFRINLIKTVSFFAKSREDKKQIIKFFSETSEISNDIERKFLENRIYLKGKVILLFDGFDEISPKYKSDVINLLHN
jgi:predicted NACHT family NTPase